MKALVAEDDDDLREMLRLTLERAGWKVLVAQDGRDALRVYHDAIITDEYFDLLLLDVEMPRLNGFAVGVNIRNLEKFGDVPRGTHIYFTGHDDVVPPEQLLETLFADGYLRKPISPDELLSEIDKVMKLSQGRGPEI